MNLPNWLKKLLWPNQRQIERGRPIGDKQPEEWYDKFVKYGEITSDAALLSDAEETKPPDSKCKIPLSEIIELVDNGKLKIEKHSARFYSGDNAKYSDDAKRIYFYLHTADGEYRFEDKITKEFITLTKEEFDFIAEEFTKLVVKNKCTQLFDKIQKELN